MAADAGFDGWTGHFAYLNSWGRNPDLPGLSPWVTTRALNDPPWVFGPNPYSVWVPEDERIELGKDLFRRHVDEVWTIGCLGYGMAVYGVYLAGNDLRNVPARVRNTEPMKTPANAFPMTF